MKYSTVYLGLIGLMMIIQWTISFFSGQIIELETEPIRIGFHLAAELITAACLIASAGALYKHKGWGRELALVATGMLFYTSLVSPGYFAQQGEWFWLGMFGLILIGGIFSIFQITNQR